jgi:hypothetical protein
MKPQSGAQRRIWLKRQTRSSGGSDGTSGTFAKIRWNCAREPKASLPIEVAQCFGCAT